MSSTSSIWLPGEEERAEREALEAVDAYEHAKEAERSYPCEALARTDLPLVRAGLRELDGARAALRPVLDLPPAQRIGAVVVNAQRVHVALRHARYRGSTAAREVQEEIEAFSQTAARAASPR